MWWGCAGAAAKLMANAADRLGCGGSGGTSSAAVRDEFLFYVATGVIMQIRH